MTGTGSGGRGGEDGPEVSLLKVRNWDFILSGVGAMGGFEQGKTKSDFSFKRITAVQSCSVEAVGILGGIILSCEGLS